jgi:hypothetical protein
MRGMATVFQIGRGTRREGTEGERAAGAHRVGLRWSAADAGLGWRGQWRRLLRRVAWCRSGPSSSAEHECTTRTHPWNPWILARGFCRPSAERTAQACLAWFPFFLVNDRFFPSFIDQEYSAEYKEVMFWLPRAYKYYENE